MSAKAVYAKPTFRTPSIPPELWLTIFRFATWVPSQFHPDLGRIRTFETSTRTKYNAFKDSFRAKRSIVTVCKLFQALCTPYLYEFILLRRTRTLPLLAATLANSKESSTIGGPEAYPFGWWTKRLDIALGGHDLIQSQYLVEIIRCLPNLEIIIFFINDPKHHHELPPSFLQTLAETSGSSLRVISWGKAFIFPSPDDWRTFLAAAPSLQMISSPYKRRNGETNEVPLTTLLRLQTLVFEAAQFEEYTDDGLNWFPALQNVVFNDIYLFWSLVRWKSFILIYGPGLTCVTLHVSHHSPSPLLQTLASHCPNLIRLNFYLRSWILFPINAALPPVTYLGISSKESQSPRAKYKEMFTVLGTMVFAKLKVVQLLEQKHVVELSTHHAKVLHEGVERLKERRLRLEDHDGFVL